MDLWLGRHEMGKLVGTRALCGGSRVPPKWSLLLLAPTGVTNTVGPRLPGIEWSLSLSPFSLQLRYGSCPYCYVPDMDRCLISQVKFSG